MTVKCKAKQRYAIKVHSMRTALYNLYIVEGAINARWLDRCFECLANINDDIDRCKAMLKEFKLFNSIYISEITSIELVVEDIWDYINELSLDMWEINYRDIKSVAGEGEYYDGIPIYNYTAYDCYN